MAKVPIVRPLSKAKIEADASDFLAEIQPEAFYGDDAVDIEKIYEIDLPKLQSGLRTGYTDLRSLGPNVLGFTDADSKVSYVHIELFESEDPVAHRRFRATVAHEIAHCFYHLPYLESFKSFLSGGKGLFRANQREIAAYLDPEWQVWKMAGALLMPKHKLLAMVEAGNSIYKISDFFGVNPAFVTARLGSIKK